MRHFPCKLLFPVHLSSCTISSVNNSSTVFEGQQSTFLAVSTQEASPVQREIVEPDFYGYNELLSVFTTFVSDYLGHELEDSVLVLIECVYRAADDMVLHASRSVQTAFHLQ